MGTTMGLAAQGGFVENDAPIQSYGAAQTLEQVEQGEPIDLGSDGSQSVADQLRRNRNRDMRERNKRMQ